MRTICFLGSSFICLVLLPMTSFAQQSNSSNNIEYTAKSSAVQVVINNFGSINKTSFGSAILINKEGSDYTVITAAHVICTESQDFFRNCAQPSKIRLTTPDGDISIPREVIIFPRSLDLALIKFNSPFNYTIAKIGESSRVHQGEQLYSSGYVFGNWKFHGGKVVANSQGKLNFGGRDLSHRALSIPGMSGGGVFNSRGELVCINSANLNTTETSLCVPISFYNEFNSQYNQQNVTESELYGLAQEAHLNNRHDAAIEYLNRAIMKNPKFSEAYLLRGHCYFYLGIYQTSVNDYNRYIALQPNISQSYFWRGRSEFALANYSSALISFQKAAEIQPNNYEYFLYKGVVEYNLKYYAKAIEQLDKAIVIKSDDESSHYWKGESYLELGLIDIAILNGLTDRLV